MIDDRKDGKSKTVRDPRRRAALGVGLAAALAVVARMGTTGAAAAEPKAATKYKASTKYKNSKTGTKYKNALPKAGTKYKKTGIPGASSGDYK